MLPKEISLSSLIEVVRTIEDYKSASLSQYAKRCTINSRAYIQDEIADEPVTADLLKNIHNVYIGWILTALQLDTHISDGRKVRDVLEVVGTENYVGEPLKGVSDFYMASDWNRNPRDEKKSGIGSKDKPLKDISLPSGRIIEVSFSAPNTKTPISVEMFVQLLPRILPSEVCSEIISLNFNKDITKRWLQYKAGEIKFWKDFIFQLDVLKKRRKALKRDRTGDLKNILDRQRSGLTRQLLKLFRVFPDMQNIANSILIMEKRSFDKYTNDASLNFKKYNDRQKFFGKSYSMIVATVDPMYNRVELFINGIDAKAIYTYRQMTSAAKSDKMDLVELISAMNQGQSPRF